jgi:hypothetical protein
MWSADPSSRLPGLFGADAAAPPTCAWSEGSTVSGFVHQARSEAKFHASALQQQAIIGLLLVWAMVGAATSGYLAEAMSRTQTKLTLHG